MKEVTNQRLQQILSKAISQAQELTGEREEDIQKAWNETIQEAHDNDKEKLPLIISCNFLKNNRGPQAFQVPT